MRLSNLYRFAPRLAALLPILTISMASVAAGAGAPAVGRALDPNATPVALRTSSTPFASPATGLVSSTPSRAPVAGLVQAKAGTGLPTADGLTSTPTWTVESNIANGNLGSSTAVAGDVNADGFDDLVSYGYFNGRLYLYFGGPGGPTLAAGYPVTIPSGASMVNAAGDVNGDGYADVTLGWPGATFGAIRVYHGGPSGFDTATPFYLFQNFSNDFGALVGPAGDVNGDGYDDLIVGSPGFPGNTSLCGSGTSYTGKVDVFYGSSTGLSTTIRRWTLIGCRHVVSGGGMGTAAATAGDVNGDGYDDIVVGAPGATILGGGSTAYGSAWVIYGSASGLPLQPGYTDLGWLVGATRVDSPTPFASFGSAAITAGDVNADGYADVAVGAPSDDTYATNAGYIRVYAGGPSGMSTTEMYWESSSFANTQMGRSLVPAGDINGDRRGDLLIGTTSGALVAPSIGNGLLIVQTLAVPSSYCTAGDVNGDGLSDVVVGDGNWSNGQTSEGRLSVYAGRGETGRIRAWSYVQGVEEYTNMGWSVSSAGDVNGDGYDDVLVGSPGVDDASSGEYDNGSVSLFLGAAGALSPSAAFSAFGGGSGDQLGVAVTQAGDLNGDGYCDVVAGAHQPGIGANGKVLVWYGGPSAPVYGAAPDVVLTGPSVDSYFGSALSGGDFNGDGFGDLAVGAPYDEAFSRFFTYNNAGRVFVYYGGPAGVTNSAAVVLQLTQDDAHFGTSLTGEADTDGDSHCELVIGAPDYDVPSPPFTLPDGGGVFEYGRSGSTWLTFRRMVWNGISFDRFGAAVAHAGDVDGDGFGDVIVGSSSAVNTVPGEGGAWVFHGGASGLVPSPLWSQAGGEQYGGYGSSVCGAGDVNGDGLSDILVGAVFQEAGGVNDRGTARLYLGPLPTGAAAAWTAYGPSFQANLGHAIANAGDVDGDGWSDFIFGEPGYTNTAYREGLIELYTGSWGLAPPAVTHVGRASGPIAPLGLTDVGGLTFLHNARSAAGRTSVKLAWRLTGSVIGTPAPTIAGMQGSYTPTGPVVGSGSQVSLNQAVSGLQSGFPYAWQLRTRSRSVYFPSTKATSYSRNGALEWDLRVPGSLDAPMARDVAPELMLSAPAPNPSRAGSFVRFALPRATQVRIGIYDAQGRRVRQVVDALLAQGPHDARWDGTREDGTQVETGVYFYRFEADGAQSSRRVVLIR